MHCCCCCSCCHVLLLLSLLLLLKALCVVQGYVVGTYLYFAIVFSLPICVGLAAIAMDLPVSRLALPCPILPCRDLPILSCTLPLHSADQSSADTPEQPCTHGCRAAASRNTPTPLTEE